MPMQNMQKLNMRKLIADAKAMFPEAEQAKDWSSSATSVSAGLPLVTAREVPAAHGQRACKAPCSHAAPAWIVTNKAATGAQLNNEAKQKMLHPEEQNHNPPQHF